MCGLGMAVQLVVWLMYCCVIKGRAEIVVLCVYCHGIFWLLHIVLMQHLQNSM